MSPCEHEIKNGRNWGLVQFLNYLQFCTHLCLNACYFNNPFSLYRNLKCQPFSCMMKIWCGKLCFHNLLSHCIIRKQKYLIIVLFIFFCLYSRYLPRLSVRRIAGQTTLPPMCLHWQH